MRGAIKVDMAFLKKRPLSYSSLREFKRSPKHYIHYLQGGKPDKPAFEFGRQFDVLVLQGSREFLRRYAILPEDKKKHADFVKSNKGKEFIKLSDFIIMDAMCDSIMENAEAAKLLKGIKVTQRKLTWTDKATGLPLISYVDGEGARDRQQIFAELKSSKDASKDQFERDAASYGYYFQCGMYAQGYAKLGDFRRPYYIVVEKGAPYCANVYRPSDDFINLGKQELEKTLTAFKHCLDNNLWHQGYEFYTAVGYAQLDLPYWMKKNLDE